jgi:hypothetical protein
MTPGDEVAPAGRDQQWNGAATNGAKSARRSALVG